MNGSTRFSRLLCAAGVVVGLSLAGPALAQEKVKGDPGKGEAKVIVIQLDASKVPPDLIEKLMALSRTDAAKKPAPKKGEGDGKKGEVQKPNLVQVDLNKLSPDLAKRLMAELSKGKDAAKPAGKNDDDKKGGKKPAKDDDDDDTKGKKGGKDKDDDDDDKGGKKKGK